MGLLERILSLVEKVLPIVCFVAGMLVNYWLNFKSMKATMNLAHKIRENMPYETYEEIEQTETE